MRPRSNKSRSRSRWQDQSMKSLGLGLVYKTHMAFSLGLGLVFKYWSRQSVLKQYPPEFQNVRGGTLLPYQSAIVSDVRQITLA